jgi:hypothetical protein
MLFTKPKKKFWVNEVYEEREKYGEFHAVFPLLLKQPDKFCEYMITPVIF